MGLLGIGNELLLKGWLRLDYVVVCCFRCCVICCCYFLDNVGIVSVWCSRVVVVGLFGVR